MRILDKLSVDGLIGSQLENIPYAILSTICQSPGISEGAIIGAITNQLPSIINTDSIRDHCINSVRWFRQNGDIAASGNRRYIALPTYLVQGTSNKLRALLRVCGQLSFDHNLRQLVDHLGGEFERQFVSWLTPNRSQQESVVGYRRQIQIPSQHLDDLLSKLEEIKIRVITPNEVEAQLPSIGMLRNPSNAAFTALPPNWGSWHQYNPKARDEVRWTSGLDYDYIAEGLVRWQPSEDWRGEQSARYFFKNPLSSLLAELSQSNARLWMLYLDWHADNSRRVEVEGNLLHVPYILPDSYLHWLRLVSDEWYRRDILVHFQLTTPPHQVLRKLESALGLRTQLGKP